jgi:hypothetical protein
LIRGTRAAREHAVSKSGCETLDLIFDLLRHVHVAAVWHVAIGVQRVLSSRRPGRIDGGVLHGQDEWLRWMFASEHCSLRGGNLLESAAQMQRGGASSGLSRPRYRRLERPVDLEHARPRLEALEPPPIAVW